MPSWHDQRRTISLDDLSTVMAYSLIVPPTKRKNRTTLAKAAASEPDVNLPDRNGFTPLMIACNREPLDVVRKTIAAGADVNKSDRDGFGPMMCACVEGRTDVISYLLALGAEVDRADKYGRTPLSWTVTKGDYVEAAEALISAGANVNCADKDGFTPLMRAALMNHVRCFEVLVRKGADTDLVNSDWRKTALEMAIERGSNALKKVAESVRSERHRGGR